MPRRWIKSLYHIFPFTGLLSNEGWIGCMSLIWRNNSIDFPTCLACKIAQQAPHCFMTFSVRNLAKLKVCVRLTTSHKNFKYSWSLLSTEFCTKVDAIFKVKNDGWQCWLCRRSLRTDACSFNFHPFPIIPFFSSSDHSIYHTIFVSLLNYSKIVTLSNGLPNCSLCMSIYSNLYKQKYTKHKFCILS